MSNVHLLTDVAADHGLNTEYVTRLFKQMGLPIERTRSPRSNRWCNATTDEGRKAFDQARRDDGFHKLQRKAVA